MQSAATHEVFNQALNLENYNLFDGNQALQSALKFNAPGLDTADLQALGSVAAYVAVKRVAPQASLNLLWALEGALTGEHWQRVATEHRTSLLLALGHGDAMISGITRPFAQTMRDQLAAVVSQVRRRSESLASASSQGTGTRKG